MHYFNRIRHRVPAAVVTVAVLSTAWIFHGCSDPEPAPMGRIEVNLTDAPFVADMVESADVVIDQVRVHVGGSNEDESGWVVVADEPLEVNLLDLQNGVTELLASALIPVGSIDQLRLVVSSASVTLTDGRTLDLDIPSGSTSGIKVFPSPPIEVVGDLTTEILVDFDVSRSFSSVPSAPDLVSQIERFRFHPSLRVSNVSEVGTVSGTAWFVDGTGNPSNDRAAERVVVTAYRGDEEITSAITNEDGRYMIMGLEPGTYTLTAVAFGTVPQSVTATVVAGNDSGGNDFRLVRRIGGGTMR